MTIAEKLAAGLVVGDGANGTLLQRAGLPGGASSEAWGLEHPDAVTAIHAAYFEAGADCVTTNTFGGNRIRLHSYGLEDRVGEINRRNVELARRVCPPGRLVGGSIGPIGELLAPLGSLSAAEAEEAFAEQAAELAGAGVDFFIIETMSALEEAQAAVSGVHRAADLPILLSFSFQGGPRGFRTFMGASISEAVDAFRDAGLAAIGANCGRGYDEAVGITRELAARARIPVFVQPNAGIPREGVQGPEYSQAPAAVEGHVQEILKSGARLVGGCCGTDPGFIRMIRRLADRFVAQEANL